jgi:hypothetical protein
MATDVLEVNAITGEVVERSYTDSEKAQRSKDAQDLAKTQADVEAKESAKTALLAKLGITADEAALLLGGN